MYERADLRPVPGSKFKRCSIVASFSAISMDANNSQLEQRVIEELKRIYKTKIMPLEQLYKYDIFISPLMSDAEFDSKPQVMLVGQYSVGKTSVSDSFKQLCPED